MLDTRLIAAAVLAALCLTLLALLVVGWRRKLNQQADRYPAPPAPSLTGRDTVAAWDDIHYVATTPSDAPLERIATKPYGFRGRCSVQLLPEGLVIGIAGEVPFFISRESLDSLHAGTATIDRAVEPGGLSVLRWRPGPTGDTVDSVFRFVDERERSAFHTQVNATLLTAAL